MIVSITIVFAAAGAARAQDGGNVHLSPPRLPDLLSELKSPDLRHRVKAARSIAAIKPLPPEVVPALIEILKNPDDARVEGGFAVRALGNAGAPAIPALTRLLKDNDQRNTGTRIAAIHALSEMATEQPKTWPLLVRAFKDDNLQAWASMGAAGVGAPIVPLLRQALRDPDERMRRGAVQALQMAQGAARDAVPELILALKSNAADIRALAATDLARIGPFADDAVASLSVLLNDPVDYVREAAGYAIAVIDPTNEKAMPILIEAIKNRNSTEHWNAVEALGAMGGNARDAIPTMESLLVKDPDIRFRVAIVKALAAIAGPAATPILTRVLTGNSNRIPDLRLAVIEEIKRLGPDGASAIPALVQVLGDGSENVRRATVEALHGYGKAAVPALIAALHDPDLYVREGSVEVLRQLKPLPDDVAKALTDAAFKDKSTSVRTDAATVLQQAGIEAGRTALAQLEREAEASAQQPETPDENRLYTRNQIFADIQPDADHKYPLSLEHLLSFGPGISSANGAFVATVYQGKDRPDRLIFWRGVDEGKYRQLQVIDAGPEPSNTFDPPTTFSAKVAGDWQWGRFVNVGENVWRGHWDMIFAIDGDKLLPVEVESPQEWYREKLKPGEEMVDGVANYFSNQSLEFRFEISGQGSTPASRAITQIVGTYKIVKYAGGVSAVAGGARGQPVVTAEIRTEDKFKMVPDTAAPEPASPR